MTRIPMLRFFAVGLLVFATAPAMAADAAAGKAAFERVACWSCHDHQGQGGRHGPTIARIQLPYAAFSAFVRTTSGNMPPFTAVVLPDSDLEAIYAYLQSIPAPPDPQSIPLLQDLD